MKKQVNILRIIALCIGIGIFLYTIHNFGGVEVVLKNLAHVGFGYAFVIANSFLWMIFYTAAWQRILHGLNETMRYFALLKVKLSGEGVNFMTPLGFMAGDPVRILMLKRYVGPTARLHSVVVDRMLHTLSAQVMNLIGAGLIFTQDIDFPVWLHYGLLALYSILILAFISILVSMLYGHGFGLFEHLFKLINLERRFPKANHKLVELREHFEYYRGHSKWPILQAFLYHFSGRILGAVEIMIIFYCFEGEFKFVFSIILATLTSFFTIAFGFIPGALGVVEALYARFAILYGYSPEMGLTIQIVRRLRVIFWILIGILVLDFSEIVQFFKKLRKNKGT
jgi:hypothetical protein